MRYFFNAICFLNVLFLGMARAEMPRVQFDASGTVRYGDKLLSFSKGHLIYSVNGKELVNIFPIWSAPSQNYGEAGYGDAIATHRYDVATGEYLVQASLPKAGEARYEIRLKVLEDGLLNYRVVFSSTSELKSKGMQVRFPLFNLDGTTIRDENETMSIEKFEGERKNIVLPKGFSPEFFAENPDRSIRFILVKHGGGEKTRYGVSDARHDKSFMPRMEYRPIFTPEGEFEMLIDIRKMSAERQKEWAAEIANPFDILGIAKFNRMELPNFSVSPNLIQNPSFEEGFHAWSLRGASWITNVDHLREGIVIDTNTSFHGQSSIRFQMRPSYSDRFSTTMSLVEPYAIQLKVGKPYTFSFYAKSEQEGLTIGSVAWGALSWGKWLGNGSFKLTKDWKRYSMTFIPTESLTTVMFGVPWWFENTYKSVQQTTHFWADAFQLEEGEAATAFAVKPISIGNSIQSYYRIKDDKEIAFQLINNTPVDRTLDCRLSIRDFHKNEIASKVVSGLKLPANALVPLTISANKEMAFIGYYTVRIAIEDQQSGYKDYDFYAVPVLDSFSKQELIAMKNRLFFTFGNIPGGDRERNMRVLREIGVGGVQTAMYPVEEGVYRTVENEGLLQFTGLFGSDPRNMYIADPREQAVVAPMWTLKSFDSPEYTAYTNFLKNVFLPKYRHYQYIKFFNEPGSGSQQAPIFEPAMMGKLYRDIYPIIKSVIPGAKVISSDPANIGDAKRKWHEEVLRAGGLQHIDILAGHPYREKPERPDLESDAEEFIAMADRSGFKGDIWFTEAGNHPLLPLPGFGTAEPRHAPLSSDATDRRSLIAFNIRYLLLTMKYASRVKMFLNWQSGITMNALTGQPSPVAAEYNAVARALGNAVFVRDYKYGDGVKTLLFENDNGQGVAAIWDFDDQLEAGERRASRFRLYVKDGAGATDLFGRPMPGATRSGDFLDFDVDYVPSFMIAPDIKTLQAALEKSGIRYESTEQVSLQVGLESYTSFKFDFKNRGSTAFSGNAQMKLNGNSRDFPLSIKPLSETSLILPIGSAVDTSQARYSVAIPLKILDSQGGVLKNYPEGRYQVIFCNRKNSAITIDGDLSDWVGYRSGVIGKEDSDLIEYSKGGRTSFEDLGARFFFAWDEDGLYLALEVSDDTHRQPNTLGKTWDGDSLQVFIDAFRDGQETSLNMQDDYAYSMAKTPDGDQVYRGFSADRQLAWLDIQNNVLEPNIELKIKRNESRKQTIYEMRFPAKTIAPVALKKGKVIGLGIMVNDSDGEHRKSAITTCNGKEGWMKPYNLPFFISVGSSGNPLE